MSCSAAAAAFSSSSLLYFLRLFLAALAALLRLTSPTMADRLWSPRYRSSTFCARISRAMLRFWLRERVACDLTTMPVGTCLSWTAELVLFYREGALVSLKFHVERRAVYMRRTIFCPPGPLPLRYDSSISESGGGFGRGGSALASTAGPVVKGRTAAVEML